MLRRFAPIIAVMLLVAVVPDTAMAQWGSLNSCGCAARPMIPAPVPVIAPMPIPVPVPVFRPVRIRPLCVRCVPPMPIMPQPICRTHLQPIVSTRMVPQQVTTLQPVTTTRVRREATTVEVPVTRTRQVTVDEGAYKTVWVPKMVTKNVQETTVQKQVQYRDVPYQVTQHVPRTHTQMVPQRTVQMVPQTRVGFVPGCAGCGPTAVQQHAMAPPIAMPSTTAPVTAVPVPNPTTSASPTKPIDSAQNIPQGDWVKVPAKSAQAKPIQQQSYQHAGQATEAKATNKKAAPPRRLFRPVPTAAAVWQSSRR